jgi:pimeloyl-ACP methyl ester carboxylesterase
MRPTNSIARVAGLLAAYSFIGPLLARDGTAKPATAATTINAIRSTISRGFKPAGDRMLSAAQENQTDVAPPPLGQLVDIGGRKLHLICSGEGKPTVLLENGSDGFSIDWALVQPQVAKFARVCTYDRAGFAWSDRGPAINTVEQTMDDLHLLLSTAAITPPYILVGHSIGGMYVRAYQRRYPQEVVGMVLVDATPEEDLGYSVNGVNKTGIDMSYDDMETAYAPFLKNPPPLPKPWTEVPEPFKQLPPDLQRARMWASRQWFAQIDMPHSWITAESWKEEFVALRRSRLSHSYVLGDLPLIVLHRGRRTDPVLDNREAEMAKMSHIGLDWVAKESDHFIQLWQPDMVVTAIRQVSKAK